MCGIARRAEIAKIAERARSKRSIRVIETNQYIEGSSLFLAITQNSSIPILPFTERHWSRREIRIFGEAAVNASVIWVVGGQLSRGGTRPWKSSLNCTDDGDLNRRGDLEDAIASRV